MRSMNALRRLAQSHLVGTFILVTEAYAARTDHGIHFEAVLNRGNDLPSGSFGIALKSDAIGGLLRGIWVDVS